MHKFQITFNPSFMNDKDLVSHLKCWFKHPLPYMMFGRSCAKHVHCVLWHEHSRVHDGMLLSWEVSFVAAFVSV